MATVNITDTLLDEVGSRVNQMANDAAKTGYLKKSPDSNKPLIAALLRVSEEMWYADAPQLKGVVPQEWLCEIDRLDYKIRLPREKGDVSPEDFSIIVRTTGKWRVPACIDHSYGNCTMQIMLSELPVELQSELLEYAKERDAHVDKYKAVHHQVKAFLKSCTTLNAAVKKFPNIAMYIPQNYIDRMNKRVVKNSTAKKAEGKEVTLDTTLLSTVGAKHMLGS